MKLEKKDVYVPVSVDVELPIVGKDVFALFYNDVESHCVIIKENGDAFWINSWDEENTPCHPTHWLKKETLYTFSEEELREFANKIVEVYNDNVDWNTQKDGWENEQPTVAEYINNLIKQD